MIDNSEKILNFLEFNKDHYYEIIVMKRKKDNPEEANAQSSRIVKQYLIDSKEYFEKKYEEIKSIADVTNARVYIKLTPYSKKKIALKSIQLLVDKLENEDYSFNNLIVKAIGNCTPENKLWVIDIDYDRATEKEILYIQTAINDCDPSGNHIVLKVPTPNGVHLITKPFNTQQFLTKQDVYYKCEIHKNNPTLLYTNIK
jgi:hypothetical protein